MFDKLPIPEFYIKKIDLRPNDKPTDQTLNEFLTNFNYEKIVLNTESITKWTSNFNNLFYDSIKSSSLNQDGKKINKFV